MGVRDEYRQRHELRHHLHAELTGALSARYPSDSRIASTVVRRQVYIGVSRTVYFDDSVSRRSCTRSRNSAAESASKATTKSWSSSPKEYIVLIFTRGYL